MNDKPSDKKRKGLARRIFTAVGAVGSTVGEAAGDLLRSAGKSAKGVGERAVLKLASEISETPRIELRELAETFTNWLVSEQQGRAELQQQKPSTVELTEVRHRCSFYEVRLEEPGLLGRRFRIVIRVRPLSDWKANFPATEESFHAEALFVLEWPSELLDEPTDHGVLIWDQAAIVGKRNSAVDLIQRFLQSHLAGTFVYRKVSEPKPRKGRIAKTELIGREQELEKAMEVLLRPRPRRIEDRCIVSISAPGGTGKSYFLKALRADCASRTLWASVDHQALDEASDSVSLVGGLLIKLARQLEEQGVRMDRFGKEALSFRKRDEKGEERGGVFTHLKSAAQSAAGTNPLFSAVSAGVVFLTSWRQEAQEESEALVKDNSLRSLTAAFKADLVDYAEKARGEHLCWSSLTLAFDTYEWLAPLTDTWIRTELLADDFLSRSGTNLLLVGREHLLRTDTRWSEWQHQIVSIALTAFDRQTSDLYLESLGVERERFGELFELTEGLPLFLNLAANIREVDAAVSALVKRVLEEIPLEYHSDFLTASSLESFDEESLKAAFPEKTTEQRRELRRRLDRATFSIEADGRIAFISPVRRIFQRANKLS